MEDLLKKRLGNLQAIKDSAYRRANLYSDLVKIPDKKITQSLGALQKAPAPGKKLQKIGFIMFWVPEPSGVTSVVGGPMILAGKYLDKVYNSSTIDDIGIQTNKTISSISDFKKSLL
jgi:hypothetical protein